MATVFDTAVKTQTRPNGAAGDAITPSLGLLNVKAMPTTTALGGTNATDAKIIHGDRWQQIDKNEFKFINENLKTTIDGNENRMLRGNLVTTVMQTTKDERFGTHLANFYDISTFNYFHQRHEQHTDVEQESQPTSHSEVTSEVNKVEEKHFDSTIWKAEVVKVVALGAVTTKVEAIGTAGELFGAKTGIGGIEATGLGWRQKAEALENKLDAVATWFTGAKAEAGGPETAIRPVFVGILVAVHMDSPFA